MVNFVTKITKLYKIQEVFEKYNIFDKHAFHKDPCFRHILKQYEPSKVFDEVFHKKYSYEISQTDAYKSHCKQQNTIDNPNVPKPEVSDEAYIGNQEIYNDFIDEVKPSINELNKIMYKKIAKISHPDKTTKTHYSEIFKHASKHANCEWTIGLIYCCTLLKIKLHLDVDSELEEHLYHQMRTVIAEILTLHRIRNN